MATMEHVCPKCNWATMNNSPRSPDTCPKCGSELSHYWDEDKADFEPERPERDEEDDDEEEEEEDEG